MWKAHQAMLRFVFFCFFVFKEETYMMVPFMSKQNKTIVAIFWGDI